MFDRVGSYKLNKLFPNESKERIADLLANAWRQLCNYNLWVALYLQDIRYTRYEQLQRKDWARQKPNIKFRDTNKDPGMIGFVFSSPTDPAFKTPTSQLVQEMDLFKELQLYLETKGYNSALPICSDAESFGDIEVFNWFHFSAIKIHKN